MRTLLITLLILSGCAYEPLYTFTVRSIHHTGSYTIYDANEVELETIKPYKDYLVRSETDSVLIVDNTGRNHDRWNVILNAGAYRLDDGKLIH